MKQTKKTVIILSMILAPFTYLAMGQIVSFCVSFYYIARFSAGGLEGQELAAAVGELLQKNVVPLSAAASLICLPIVYFLFFRQRFAAESAEKGLKLLLVIPFGIAASIGLNYLIALSGIPQRFPEYNRLSEHIYQGNILFELAALALIPGILEELIFRGVLYGGLRTMIPIPAANLLSALIFGAVHMNVTQFLYAFFLGLLFGWVYERYGNLWASALMHMAGNTASILLTEWKPLKNLIGTDGGSMAVFAFLLFGCLIVPAIIWKVVPPKPETPYRGTP